MIKMPFFWKASQTIIIHVQHLLMTMAGFHLHYQYHHCFFACKTHASSWHECCKWQWFCAVNCVYSVLTKKSHNFSQTISNLIRQESLNNLQWKSLWFLWLGTWSIDSQIPTDFLFCSPSRCLDSEAPLDFTPVYCMWFIV